MSSPEPHSVPPEEHGIYYLGKVGQRTQITRAHEPPVQPPILPPPSVLAGQRPQLPPLSDLQPPAGPQYPQGQPQLASLPERPYVPYNQQGPYPQPLPQPDPGVRWQPPAPQGHGGPVSSFPPPALYAQKASFQSKNPGTVYEALSTVEYSPHETAARPSVFDEAAYNQNPYLSAPVSTYQSPTESYRSSTTSSSGAGSAQGTSQYPQVPPTMPPGAANAIIERYVLTIRQQPIAARACGFGERDRRVIDPPPIVQLSLRDFDPTSSQDLAELNFPFNILHCALLSAPSSQQQQQQSALVPVPPPLPTSDVTAVPDPTQANRMSRRLMGTLVASPFVGKDPEAPHSSIPNANLATFFIFPDLSCRQNGLYRLRFTLMKVHIGPNMPEGGQGNVCASVDSDVFEVYSAKDFPGVRASTFLIKELKRQGAGVSVKKGKGFAGVSAAEEKKRGNSDSDGGDEAGGDDESEDAKGKGRLRKKRV
ncbi:MAG: hypothetical protein Q9217_006605 [Psora testacea]